MLNPFKINGINNTGKENLEDEKENKALIFIFFLVILGIIGIIMFVYQESICAENNRKISYALSMGATLFFVAGAVFTFSNLIGFLFGIPRGTEIDKSAKSKSRYIGNDNLLQVSDWITKIILGLGLTQIHEILPFLKRVADFIIDNTHVSNPALIILIILYFGCIGFLFGYLWTRLYFIKMLCASDDDINNDETTAQIKTEITTDISTGVKTGEGKI